MEMTKRYMTWADGLRQKGKLAGGEKLAAGGVRHIKVKDGQADGERRPLCRGQGCDRRLLRGSRPRTPPKPRRSPGIARTSPSPPPTWSRSGRSTTWRRQGRPRAERSGPEARRIRLPRDSASRLVAALARRLGRGPHRRRRGRRPACAPAGTVVVAVQGRAGQARSLAGRGRQELRDGSVGATKRAGWRWPTSCCRSSHALPSGKGTSIAS